MELMTKLQHRLNLLELCLCDNLHIQNPAAVQTLITKLKVHDTHLSSEDSAYVKSAQIILDQQIPYDGS